MEELKSLLRPSWGTEKWILEGWNKITRDEQKSIMARVDDLFKNGLPFKLRHDKLLYIYTFSLMAQLEVLGIQLPMRFEEKIQKPEFKSQMRAQLVDEIFHAIVFTKIVFLLCAPYDSPPSYNDEIEKICEFMREQECLKVGVVIMNLICDGLVEEVFKVLYQNNIAPELFEKIIKDEKRHVCEADLYREIGLPDQIILKETLQKLEKMIISAFALQPKYAIALSVLLGPRGIASFLLTLHEKYKSQLKKIKMHPGEEWELFLKMAPEIYAELIPHSEELLTEIDQEIDEVEMTPMRKVLMTQFNDPGDPTMVAQFNLDITDYGFFESNYSEEIITLLMMQAVSHVLASHHPFRNFLSYKKLYCTKGAYVSLGQKLPDCGDHMGTIYFKDCHELTTNELSIRMKRAIQMMTFCFKKREQIEQKHPELKQRLDELLYGYAHDLYPCPVPGSYGVYIGNMGSYGYTQAISPLLKQTGLHILLLSVEKKPVWNQTTKSFEAKDLLPISISADNRIFDGILPIPELLKDAFQKAFNTMKEQVEENVKKNPDQMKYYEEKIETIADDLLTKKNVLRGGKLISQIMSQKVVVKEVKRVFGEELEIYGEKLSQYSNFKNMANNLLLDYLGFNAEEAAKDANFNKIVDKMLAENLELGYRTLASLQTAWVDYIDIETAFDTAYKKVAHSRLNRLAQLIPAAVRYSKLFD